MASILDYADKEVKSNIININSYEDGVFNNMTIKPKTYKIFNNSKEAKEYYLKQEKELKNKSNTLNQMYSKNGIYYNKGGYTPNANNAVIGAYPSLPAYDPLKKKVLMNSGPSKAIYLKELESENKKKFEELKNSKEGKILNQQVKEQYDTTAKSYYDYLTKKVEEDDIGIYDKTIGTVARGAKKVIPFNVGRYSMTGEDGQKYIMPTYDDLKQQKVSDSIKNPIAKVLNSALYETGKIGTTVALNTIVPGSGTAVYYGDMYLNRMNEAVKDGYDVNQSLVYATVGTATEVLTGKVLGGTTKAIFGGKSSNLSGNISKNLSKWIKNNPKLVNAISNGIAEGGEEFVQEYIDKINRNLILDKQNPLKDLFTTEKFNDALFSASVGMITGGLSGSFNGNNTDININSIENTLQNNNYIQNSNINGEQLYNFVESNNEKINSLRKSAIEIAKFDNSKKTIDLMNTIEKVIEDKNYNVVFDDKIVNKQGQSVNAQISTNANGEVEIKLNPNSDRAGEFLLVHEITHAIETDNMKKLILDYANKNSEFNSALESLKQSYGTNDVSSEVIADISGQLLGNQEFINSLSTTSPNVFKRIYNAIISLANKITGNSKESLFLKDLKNKWETAYRTQNNNLNGETFYAKQFQDILLRNKNLNKESMISYINSKESESQNINNSLRLQNDFKNNVKNGEYKNKATDYILSITSETKGKILRPNGKNTDTTSQNYILRMIGANKLPELFENAVYVDTIAPMKSKSLNPNELGYHHFVAPININGKEYRVLLSGREKQNSKKLYSLNIEIIPQKNGNVPLANANSGYQSRGTFPSAINIADLVQNVKIYNYDTGQYQVYNSPDIKYSMQESQNNTQELDNSSFNLKLKDIINSAIENQGKDGRVDLDSNLGYLYDEIYNKYEKILNRDINDEDFELIENELNNFYKDGYYVSKNSYSPEEYAEVVNDKLDDVAYKLKEKGFDVEESKSIYSGLVTSRYFSKDGITIRIGDHDNSKGYGSTFTQDELYNKSVSELTDYVIKNWNKHNKNDNSQNSQNNSSWQKHLEDNYKATGTRTNFKDISNKSIVKPLPTAPKTDVKPLPKVTNPLEISKLTKDNASTTPKLSRVNVNKINDGDSKFWNNINEKTNMLNQDSKNKILVEDDIKFYDKVTNKDSLEKAFNKLINDGANETLSWFSKESANATAVDVAEGWILLKQYADSQDYDGMVSVAKKLRDMGTKAGQTVQAFNILARMTPEGMVKYAQIELSEAYDNMVKNKSKDWIDKYKSEFDLKPDEVSFIMDTMNEVSKMEDGYDKRVKLAEIQKLMTDKLPPEKGAGIKAWMRVSMLFNPKTQVRNVLGNAVITPVNYFSDLLSSSVDRMIAKKTNVRTTGTTKIGNYAKGFKTGLYQSYNDFKKGINTRNIDGNRFEIGQGKSFKNKTAIGKSLNKVDSILSFMLDAGDRGFYEASFTNSINNQLVLNKTSEVTQDMIDIATQEALSRTWQDNNQYTKAVLGIRKLMNFGKNYGLGDILIPFAKTPANLTKAIVDYSPAGLISTLNSGIKLKNSLSNGQYTAKMQHEFVQKLGKATAGTMLYVLGYALANAGIISGDSDDDKDTRDFMKNTLGINSYSIKIGGKTFSYDWAQPLAAPLSITSNIVKNKKEGATLLENISTSLDEGFNVILEQSFFESINNVFSDSGKVVEKLGEELLGLPSRAIPTLMKQLVDLTDGTQRQSFEYDKPLKSAVNKVKAKIPGISKTLAPSVDSMGREIQKYGGKNNIFNVLLNPANVNNENISESAKEIYDIYKLTGKKDIMPRVAPYYIDNKGVKVLMSSKQRAEYQKISGNIIESNVKKLKSNPTYKNLSDEDKSEILNNIVNYSYNKARKDVLNIEMSDTYNKVNKWVESGGNVYDFYSSNYKINSIKDTYDELLSKADDKNRTRITNAKRQEVFNFINSQSINKYKKILLYKMSGYSVTQYKEYMYNYINSMNISVDEKKALYSYLYGN